MKSFNGKTNKKVETKNSNKDRLFFKKKNDSSFFGKEDDRDKPFFMANRPMGENKTGIPDKLKENVENMSGISLDDVKVHRNSTLPVKYNALAFTQGSEIFLGPGQERHLAHEAWHVVQQKQGRVSASTLKVGDKNVNDDTKLENEADRKGKMAESVNGYSSETKKIRSNSKIFQSKKVIQRTPIPSRAIILDVSASAEEILRHLVSTARATSRQYSTVNWRNMFLGVINQQLMGRRLGVISHTWRDNEGLDANWSVTISFDQVNPRRTTRPSEVRNITNASGGTSTNTLGNSQSYTTGSSISVTGGTSSSVGVEAEGVSASRGSSSSGTLGLSDSSTAGSSGASGGSLTSSASSASAELINRYVSTLRVNIDCTAEAAYSNWDIINPVKWGAHLAGRQHANRTYSVGTITYDLPDYSR